MRKGCRHSCGHQMKVKAFAVIMGCVVQSQVGLESCVASKSVASMGIYSGRGREACMRPLQLRPLGASRADACAREVFRAG